jgi:hypothetical protein
MMMMMLGKSLLIGARSFIHLYVVDDDDDDDGEIETGPYIHRLKALITKLVTMMS